MCLITKCLIFLQVIRVLHFCWWGFHDKRESISGFHDDKKVEEHCSRATILAIFEMYQIEMKNPNLQGTSPGAARLDGMPGCSPPLKMSGKRLRQMVKLALSLDLVTKILQHNHFRYFRHHFRSMFPRNPTKPMFRCFPTTSLMRRRFQHTCRWI